jgi:hypothetical protein
MEAEDARHHLVVTGGLMRIYGSAEDLLMHQGSKVKGGVAAAGAHGGTAQRYEAISQGVAAQGNGDIEALAT